MIQLRKPHKQHRILPMNELNVLFDFAINTEYGQYVMLLASICYGLSHIVAQLPVSITEKIPNSVMVVVNFLSANYKHTVNKDTTPEGNKRDDANTSNTQ